MIKSGWWQVTLLVRPRTILLAIFVLVSLYPPVSQALTFTDDFNRPDSPTVGNGWSNTAGNVGGNLEIKNNELTATVTTGGEAGIFRPFASAPPITTSATLKEMNGFGGLLRRYTTGISILNDGALNHGYRVQFVRADQNFDDSGVILYDGSTQVGDKINSPFQYGPVINVSVTFSSDGSVTGTVTDPSNAPNVFNFSFGAYTIQSTGGNFSISTGFADSRTTVFTFPRIDDVSISNGVVPFLAFPLPGYTPYNVPIFSIIDHSVDPSQGNNGYYHANGSILAYNGEEATYQDNRSCFNPPKCTILGYRKDSAGTPFFLPLLGGYNDKDTSDSPDSPKNVLWYDGHPGYDYGVGAGVSIKAAHSGILCVASNRTASSGSKLWRDSTQCPHTMDVLADGNNPKKDSWDRWHTFYILLPNSNYSTWYLHADHLNTDIKNIILTQGWAEVFQGDVVAYVGNTAPPGVKIGAHLHFEVRTNGNTPADPYGDGSSGNPLLLWETAP